jgi:hypothetical protein
VHRECEEHQRALKHKHAHTQTHTHKHAHTRTRTHTHGVQEDLRKELASVNDRMFGLQADLELARAASTSRNRGAAGAVSSPAAEAEHVAGIWVYLCAGPRVLLFVSAFQLLLARCGRAY